MLQRDKHIYESNFEFIGATVAMYTFIVMSALGIVWMGLKLARVWGMCPRERVIEAMEVFDLV